MTDLDYVEIATPPSALSPDVSAQIASLRTAGANQFDAARFRYIEALAERASAYEGNIKALLVTKLVQALTAFEERFDQARRVVEDVVVQNAQQYPHAANELQRLLAAGDFKRVRQRVLTLKSEEQCASLSSLVCRLEQQPAENIGVRFEGDAGTRSELKAIRNFRNTWSKLSTDKQVAQALEQAPTNAGPINSHMLVLRSLALMRDISPDYLNRFMSYADTLLCLDQCEIEKQGIPKKRQVVKTAKK